MPYTPRIASAIALLLSSAPIVRADETVGIGSSNAVLLRPSAPRASVILMAGGNGYIAAGPGGTIGKLKGSQVQPSRLPVRSRCSSKRKETRHAELERRLRTRCAHGKLLRKKKRVLPDGARIHVPMGFYDGRFVDHFSDGSPDYTSLGKPCGAFLATRLEANALTQFRESATPRLDKNRFSPSCPPPRRRVRFAAWCTQVPFSGIFLSWPEA